MTRLRIDVKGIVQGVGFRPFVYGLALSRGLSGYVKNTSEGVLIEVEGDRADEFLRSLTAEAPPLARIFAIRSTPVPPEGSAGFRIIGSADGTSFTHVSPDVAVCEDCCRELFDPRDRRYLYPFINCTNCGPRYTITQRVPYDRPNTTMAVFGMCEACEREYDDPSDRRFHAQPNACPVCGPRVELRAGNRSSVAGSGSDPVGRAIGLLKDGAIVAVKGIGGFHLCCDATNAGAVRRLRSGKRRVNKPFALMAADQDGVRKYCRLAPDEAETLGDRRRPIVLLEKRDDGLPDEIAPNNRFLGFMLPYAPLHHLLFHQPLTAIGATGGHCGRPHFDALVMTSGNLSEEPIVIDNEEALSVLAGIADAFLLHNRDIFMRVDDSVVRPMRSEGARGRSTVMLRGGFSPEPDGARSAPNISYVRRARGYAPEPVCLLEDGPDVLGCGADIKNTFTVMKGGYAIMSQHIGDMENLETLRFFEESLDNLRQVYRATPEALGHDLHPGYASTRWALQFSAKIGVHAFAVQHHHAHIASVMAENRCTEPVIGIAFDGTGYGTDGTLWGGEFLVCSRVGFERAGHLRCIPLPGGEAAIRQPWRTAVSCLSECLEAGKLQQVLAAAGFLDAYGAERVRLVLELAGKKQFSPLSSGAGRVFDAVSALIGICGVNTFEGEAAIALESRIRDGAVFGEAETYGFRLSDTEPCVVDLSDTFRAIAEEVLHGEDQGAISQKFHNTFIALIGEAVQRIALRRGIRKVALSGGVFQNAYLTEGVTGLLERLGFELLLHRQVPCNDSCISLGQAYVVRALLDRS
jgi:hydrogenase maturation protein HypF